MIEIPQKWLDLANLPVNSPRWKSKNNDEYWWSGDRNYVVLNHKIGNARERIVCKVCKTYIIIE